MTLQGLRSCGRNARGTKQCRSSGGAGTEPGVCTTDPRAVIGDSETFKRQPDEMFWGRIP